MGFRTPLTQNAVQKVLYRNGISKFLSLLTFSLVLSVGGCFENEAAAYLTGVCKGRGIPVHKTRGLMNLRLECTADSGSVERGPALPAVETEGEAPGVWDQWRDLHERSLNTDSGERSRLRTEMQTLRQKEPTFQANGDVIYETREVWDWLDSVVGPHPSCGYTAHTRYDAATKTNIVTHSTMNTCLHDEWRHENVFCSTEKMTFDVEYVRPSQSEWNPESPGYSDLLPNKYDLMHGERENVLVYSNTFQGTSLHPSVAVKPAWNEYRSTIKINGRYESSMNCETDARNHVTVKILTDKRLTHKATPNSFDLPRDDRQSIIDPLEWYTTVNEEGQVVRSRPDRIVLQDKSAQLVEMFSRETRADSSDVDPEAAAANAKKWGKFYKNTMIKVRLYQKGWNLWQSRTIRFSAADLLTDEYNNYIIPLNSNHNPLFYRNSGFFSALGNWFFVTLQPNKEYSLRVSMYQKDMPFYKQECNPDKFFYRFCKAFYGESSYYSEEIAVDFRTSDKVNYKKLMQYIMDVI